MRPLPFDLAELQAFVAVVDQGSLGKAADVLRSSKSVLSRRIASLEYSFGAQLLVRQRLGTRATDAGVVLYATASDVLARLEEAHDEARASVVEVAGPIRVTAPLTFGTTHLAPALAAFAALNPSIILDVRLDDHVVDMQAEAFDIAIRIGRTPDDDLHPQFLAPMRPYVLASPDYLARRGTPSDLSQLAGHDVLEYTNEGMRLWQDGFGAPVDSRELNVRFRCDNGELLRSAALAGVGLVILPDFLVRDCVERGELQVLLRQHPLPPAGLFAIPAPGRPQLRRVRALVQHLAKTFGEHPPWSLPE